MFPHAQTHIHLDATAGREVVYCHACANEWYRDQHGLICPECHGEIAEIIDPDNDPRDFDHHTSASTPPERHPYNSDPEEAYIDERTHNGFTFRWSVRGGPDHPHHHHDPAVGPTLVEREQPAEQTFGPRIHRTTFTFGPFGGGTTSVMIVSGPIHAARTGPSGGHSEAETFQEYAQPLLQCSERPGVSFEACHAILDHHPVRTKALERGVKGTPPGLARNLHDILSLLNLASAMHGDAVYSQEDLGRIITGFMEANPQSNAAPPATEEALRNLGRQPVDGQMLGPEGKAECTICINGMEEGDMATFLPCNHWFHEECVTLWLKEHNTCPICRTPIEQTDRGDNNNSGSGNNNGDGNQSQPH